MSRIRFPHIAVALAALAAAALLIAPPAGLEDNAGAAALVLITIALLATALVAEHVAAILFFVTAMVFAVAPAEVVFAGFHSTAFWLVFGGLVIGAGVRRTGLAARLARAIIRRLGTRYGAVIFGVVVIGVALSFVMPSTLGRLMVLLPIVLAMSERLGFSAGRPRRAGIVLAAAFGTQMPGFTILPATVPAMVLVGASETLYGFVPSYGSYLLLHFPVLGLPKIALITGLILWLFPDRVEPGEREIVGESGPMSGQEKLLSGLLVLALMLWASDFLHGISPAWVALGVAAVCILPFVNIVPAEGFNTDINFRSAIYVAAMLGIGALVADQGIGGWLANRVLTFLPLKPGADFQNFSIISGFTVLVSMAVTQPGLPAVVTPLAGDLANAAALPVASVIMMQVVGICAAVLPYQTPPIMVAIQMGGIRMADGVKLGLAHFATTAVLLVPLDFLWWRLLGWI